MGYKQSELPMQFIGSHNYEGTPEKPNAPKKRKRRRVRDSLWSEDKTNVFEILMKKYGRDWNQIREKGNGAFDNFTDKQLIHKYDNLLRSLKRSGVEKADIRKCDSVVVSKSFNDVVKLENNKLEMATCPSLEKHYTVGEDEIIWNAYLSNKNSKEAFLTCARKSIYVEDWSEEYIFGRLKRLQKLHNFRLQRSHKRTNNLDESKEHFLKQETVTDETPQYLDGTLESYVNSSRQHDKAYKSAPSLELDSSSLPNLITPEDLIHYLTDDIQKHGNLHSDIKIGSFHFGLKEELIPKKLFDDQQYPNQLLSRSDKMSQEGIFDTVANVDLSTDNNSKDLLSDRNHLMPNITLTQDSYFFPTNSIHEMRDLE